MYGVVLMVSVSHQPGIAVGSAMVQQGCRTSLACSLASCSTHIVVLHAYF